MIIYHGQFAFGMEGTKIRTTNLVVHYFSFSDNQFNNSLPHQKSNPANYTYAQIVTARCKP